MSVTYVEVWCECGVGVVSMVYGVGVIVESYECVVMLWRSGVSDELTLSIK